MGAGNSGRHERAADMVIAAAREHYRARVSGEGLREIIVPEWQVNGEPLRLFFRPVQTMYQRHRVDAKLSEGRIPTIVEALIVRALDREGNPLFADADRITLMHHVDSDVLLEISNRMASDGVWEAEGDGEGAAGADDAGPGMGAGAPTLEAIEEN